MSIRDFDFTKIFESERIGFLSTICRDSGLILQNVVSWVHGHKPNILRIAISSKSEVVTNIVINPHVHFSFFYDKKIVSFQSKVKIVTNSMEGVPFPLTLIELETYELHDIMFYGAEISQEPMYDKTYNLEAAKKLDHQVYESMKLDYDVIEAKQ